MASTPRANISLQVAWQNLLRNQPQTSNFSGLEDAFQCLSRPCDHAVVSNPQPMGLSRAYRNGQESTNQAKGSVTMVTPDENGVSNTTASLNSGILQNTRKKPKVDIFRSSKRITKAVVLATIALGFCYLPRMIYDIWNSLDSVSSPPRLFNIFANVLILINSALNPLIYSRSLPDFRGICKKIWRDFKAKIIG